MATRIEISCDGKRVWVKEMRLRRNREPYGGWVPTGKAQYSVNVDEPAMNEFGFEYGLTWGEAYKERILQVVEDQESSAYGQLYASEFLVPWSWGLERVKIYINLGWAMTYIAQAQEVLRKEHSERLQKLLNQVYNEGTEKIHNLI